ncbi:MAG TPA: DegT/DnrJ/EryC1/StrS family aminotransferase [Sphingomonas sp.]|nr:DegT/DnrJ/EryC1/StrS family aminotransferase [Sphingomonas sp.]
MSGVASILPGPALAPLVPASLPGEKGLPLRSRWPLHAADEVEAVAEVLRSGRVNALLHGDECRAFEQAFAAFCDMPYAFSVANGTLALELALRALGIGPGDEVIVPARSFFATASCVSICGATPVFADVDPESQNITADTLAAAITPRTRAVIVVHLAGWPCAMDDIAGVAAAHGLRMIEDCAQAHGASYRGRLAGSFGDASAFSFCTDKIMSTGGEGGMVLFRDRSAAQRARSFKDHGMNFAAHGQPGGPGFRWLRDTIGSNYRMTEMQAAIGRRQLRKLPGWLHFRRQNADLLNTLLADTPALRLTVPGPEIKHAYYKYYAFVRSEELRSGWTRDRIVAEVNERGCPCFTGICPEIYLELAYRGRPRTPRKRLPGAQRLGEESLMLQVDQTLSPDQVERMAEIVDVVMAQAAR